MEFNPGQEVVFIDRETGLFDRSTIEFKVTTEYMDGRKIVKYQLSGQKGLISSNACFDSRQSLIDNAMKN